MLPIEVDDLKKEPQVILKDCFQNGTTNASNRDHFNMKRLKLVKKAKKNIIAAQARQKVQYDRKHSRLQSYSIGSYFFVERLY